jgi:histone-lysine N-methyltransferase SETMAR
MQSMERHYPQSPRKKQFKKSSSAGKVMITAFWDSEEVIIVDMTPRRKTVNSDAFIRRLIELRKLFKRVYSRKNQTEILLQHDNARPHNNLMTRNTITKFGWTVLHQTHYSPDLGPSDFHLFGAPKYTVRGTKF